MPAKKKKAAKKTTSSIDPLQKLLDGKFNDIVITLNKAKSDLDALIKIGIDPKKNPKLATALAKIALYNSGPKKGEPKKLNEKKIATGGNPHASKTFNLTPTLKKIVDTLPKDDMGINVSEIVKRGNLKESTVKQSVGLLVKNGFAVRPNRGMYSAK